MGGDTDLELAFDFAAVAMEIAAEPDLASTRQRVAHLAVAKLGVRAAALWRVSHDALRLEVCTDARLQKALTRADVTTGSLAHACIQDNANLYVTDYVTETRWPTYVQRVVAETDVRSAAGFTLSLGMESMGALVLYENRTAAFSDEQLTRAAIFAAHASIALDDATQADKATHLQRALASNRRIGMAIGVLISLYKISEQQAFDLLRIASQNKHVKLHDVAEDVILTGAAPESPCTKTAEAASRKR